MPKPVVIVEYDPAWPRLFEEERGNIEGVVKEQLMRIEHVGSASVPGLGAKPTIDIMAGLENVDAVEKLAGPLTGIGYDYRGEQEIPGWHYFDKGVRPRRFHQHIVCAEGEFWTSHLVFRDHLRLHPEAAAEYHALKIQLAREYGSDRLAYNTAKTEFVKSAVQAARSELWD